MRRLNLTLYDEVYEKIVQRSKIKKCSSIAQSARELLDLAMQVEEAAERQNSEKTDSDDLSFVIDIMKNNMKWSLETLLITRQMTGLLHHDENEISDDMLKKCKEQATLHMKKIFKEEG